MKNIIKLNKHRLCLATSKETPGKLDEDDDYLLKALKSRNINHEIVSWGSNVGNFNETLIRSTWDYYKYPQ